MAIIAVIAGLLLLSNTGVVLGYYNPFLGFDLAAMKLVYSEVNVLQTSLLLTMLTPANIVAAFFTSRGSYRQYQEGVMVLSFVTPCLVILTMLPAETELVSLRGTGFLMGIVLIGSQLGASHLLKDKAWRYGAGE